MGGKDCKVTIDKSAFMPRTDGICSMCRWRLYVDGSATFLAANRIGWEILSHLQRSI